MYSNNESDNESIFDDDSINLDFIEEFDKSIAPYKDFYKENVETLKLKFLYVNNDNKLENIKHDDLILKTPNKITYNEFIKILKSNNYVMNRNYKINSMCLYNVSIEPDNIEKIKEDDFLVNICHINDITIEPTINILQDFNELLIVFKENKKHNNRVKSKKVRIEIKNHKTRKKNL